MHQDNKHKNDDKPKRGGFFRLDRLILVLMVVFAAVYLAVLTAQYFIISESRVEYDTEAAVVVATVVPPQPTTTPVQPPGMIALQPTPTNQYDNWERVYMTTAGNGFFPVNAPVRISHSRYDVATGATIYGVVAVVDEAVVTELPQSSLYVPAPNPTATHTPNYISWQPGAALQTVERIGGMPAYTCVTLQAERSNGVYIVRAASGIAIEAHRSQLVECAQERR